MAMDNQGRDLTKMVAWSRRQAELDRVRQAEWMARVDSPEHQASLPVFAWEELEGNPIFRIKGQSKAALPCDGRKGSKGVYAMFDVEEREELCQIPWRRVSEWLFRNRA